MAILAWVMMSLAVWHFTIFLPDREWGGIVGAFVGAMLGGLIFGFIVNGFSVPSRADVHVLTSLEAIPGAILGIALMYAVGVRQERTRPAVA
jgi:hypothetical protein